MANAANKPVEVKEKLVKVRIPKTKENQCDVFVSVNDRNWLIKRGVEVEVPLCIAKALEHQEEMLIKAMEYEAAVMGKASADELN